MTNNSKFSHLPRAATGPMKCPLQGTSLLTSSHFNKGSAHPKDERTAFKLTGLLPPNVQTLDEQVDRAYQQYTNCESDLAKNTFMASMKAQNEVLYYKLLQNHLKEMFSVIYTPTEGDAIQNYSRLFRKPEGCFLSIRDQDAIEESFAAFGGEPEDIDYIVVSDGEEVRLHQMTFPFGLDVERSVERSVEQFLILLGVGQILGIGDQGIGAVLISVAKLVITTLCAGIHPSRQLPVVLDCGTNNEELLNDELYLGLKERRVRGEEYDQFVDKFVQTARKRFPNAYIHFEDFGLSNAKRILDKYQPQIPCFNDDIQGTGCVTLAAMLAALSVSKLPLENARVVIFGAGTAGTGIAEQIVEAMVAQSHKSKDDACQQIWCIDKPGLLLKSHGDKLTPAQATFARDDNEWPNDTNLDLLAVVRQVKPHVLIGTSTKPGAFSEEIVREMAKHVERPIIFPLSNPTRLHEAKPQDLYNWTDGKVLTATGSPFAPVEYKGQKYEIAECNNSTCFPGIGLGAVLSRSRLVSKKMLVAATEALQAKSPALEDPSRPLLPDVEDVREISVNIAAGVIRCAEKEGLAGQEGIPADDDELREWIRAQMWEPVYRALEKGE
ncbi:NAD-dependent malic enzyme [Penicillium diatomitis]|uniref:Malic enzyme n=1 Tax=Penicillium diatomitis TaxID=2819901 RepID=A0A9W9XCW3_9EURO|nr:NAD-dependent malic enzyme [Penicillium diatomitis]KAJ5488573.1 NAD-dependent malic enzyme [Penicillium diatomitis]